MATPYANPGAASTALTSAFTPAGGSLTPQQAAAIAAASALVPTAPAPVLSPIQPAPLAAPTVGSIYGTDPYGAASINAAQQAASNFSGAGLDQGTQDSIRQQTLASFQAEIDAQNRVYADKLSQAQVTGAGRLGSTTAIEARRGLLGSDFGAAQTDTTTAANQSVYDSINNEKAAAIANINSAGRAAVTQALAEKTAAKQAGLDSYVKYLSDAGARAEKGATTAATLLLNNGTDPNTLDATSYQNLLNNYGITREGLTSAYNAAKQAADAAAAATATKAAIDAQTATDAHNTAIANQLKAQNQTINTDNGTFATIDGGLTWKPIAGSAKPVTTTTATGLPQTSTVGGKGVLVAGIKVDPSISNDVQAVLEGRNTLYNIRQTMGRTNAAAAYMQNMRDTIAAIDPKFDFIASDAGGKFVSTAFYQRAVTAITSVQPNIDIVVGLSSQVSRIGVAGVDRQLQTAAIQIGNQKVANFHEAQKLIADEIGLALGQGTVSDMKLQLGFDVTDPSLSPEVFASNMGIVKQFITNRLDALNNQRYQSGAVGANGSPSNQADSDPLGLGI